MYLNLYDDRFFLFINILINKGAGNIRDKFKSFLLVVSHIDCSFPPFFWQIKDEVEIINRHEDEHLGFWSACN